MSPWILPITFLTIIAIAGIHYEVLMAISKISNRLSQDTKRRHRNAMFVVILGAILGHILEIWFFGGVLYLICQSGSFGGLEGHLIYQDAPHLFPRIMDYIYVSAVSYTSLGFGDILPVGAVRFFVAMETLTGIVMLGWTTSFTFLQMQTFWKPDA